MVLFLIMESLQLIGQGLFGPFDRRGIILKKLHRNGHKQAIDMKTVQALSMHGTNTILTTQTLSVSVL